MCIRDRCSLVGTSELHDAGDCCDPGRVSLKASARRRALMRAHNCRSEGVPGHFRRSEICAGTDCSSVCWEFESPPGAMATLLVQGFLRQSPLPLDPGTRLFPDTRWCGVPTN